MAIPLNVANRSVSGRRHLQDLLGVVGGPRAVTQNDVVAGVHAR